MAVDWSKRGDYIAKHGITPEQADEALNDANAVIFDPDYNTKSGRHKGDVVWGVNAWQSNSRDRRYYRHGGPDE